MNDDDLALLLDAYRDGTIGPEGAERLAAALRSGGLEAERVRRELELDGLLGQAVAGDDDGAFLRSFLERLLAESGSTDFIRTFEARCDAAEAGKAPAPRATTGSSGSHRRLRPAVDRRPAPSWVPWAAAAAAALALFSLLALPGRKPAAAKPATSLAGAAQPDSGRPAGMEASTAAERPAPRTAAVVPGDPAPPTTPAAAPPDVARAAPPQSAQAAPGSLPPSPRENPSAPPETAPGHAAAPPASAPSVRVTAAVVATVEHVEGSVQVPGAAKPEPARPGLAVLAGQGIRTSGEKSSAALRAPDGTVLELGGETVVESIAEAGPAGAGRRVTLAAGTFAVDAARQPAGRTLVFATPHAEARVVGTRFTLTVSTAGTRLEVRQGRVRFVRLSDGAEADVMRNQEAFAPAGPTTASLAARAIPPLAIAFQDGLSPSPAYAGTRDTNLCEPRSTTALGDQEELVVHSNRQRGRSAPTLLAWDLSAFPAGATVVSATVTLVVVSPMGAECGEPLWTLHELRRPWAETEATWMLSAAGKPWQAPGARGEGDRGTVALGAAVPPAVAGPCVIPLHAAGLALLQTWIQKPATNRGLIVVDDRSRGGITAASRESKTPSQRPRLTIQYNLPER
jgi:hypothetical protein